MTDLLITIGSDPYALGIAAVLLVASVIAGCVGASWMYVAPEREQGGRR